MKRTTKVISTYYAGGYALANNTNLYVTATGGVGGGVTAARTAEIDNQGRIHGAARLGGADLGAGGTLVNGSATNHGAVVEGDAFGVRMTGAGEITNFGVIEGLKFFNGFGDGVDLLSGGRVTNGSVGDAYGVISGRRGVFVQGAAGNVENFGQILAEGPGASAAVDLAAGGTVTNYGATASLRGGKGVVIHGGGTVNNFGLIVGSAKQGVVLRDGGSVLNGSATDTTATIRGARTAVDVGVSAYDTVQNFGTIVGGIVSGNAGVELLGLGRLFNEGAAASIQGADGVILQGAAYVRNEGVIEGVRRDGIYFRAGGPISRGEYLLAGQVFNDGTILGHDYGVNITGISYGAGHYAAGSIYNGSVANTHALIQGGAAGVYLFESLLANYGTVSAVNATGTGVILGTGSEVFNGGLYHQSGGALIEGSIGVTVGAGAVVSNSGTIEGTSGVAVDLTGGYGAVHAFDGAVFIGVVDGGGGGYLQLTAAAGEIDLGGGVVTVSGSIAGTFHNFTSVSLRSTSGTWTDPGPVTILAGQEILNSGTLSLQGSVTNAGTLLVGEGILTIDGPVSGNGIVEVVNGGTIVINSSFGETVKFLNAYGVPDNGTGVLDLDQSQQFAGKLVGFSQDGLSSLDLADIGFVSSTEASFFGTATRGILTVTDGTHTAHIKLKGDYLSASFVASSDGHGGVTVVATGGATVVANTPPANTWPLATPTPSPHPFVAAMAGFGSWAGAAPLANAYHGIHALPPMLARP